MTQANQEQDQRYLLDAGMQIYEIVDNMGNQEHTISEIAEQLLALSKAHNQDPAEILDLTRARNCNLWDLEQVPLQFSGDLPATDVRSMFVAAAEIPYEPPRWLIAPYFQKGKGCLIQADNGTGKTAFMCAIAAHVSTGAPLEGLQVIDPGPVLMVSVEDDLPVLRGRIEANGGDLTKVFLVPAAAGLTFISPEIEQMVQMTGAKLLVFDPFQAFLGSNVDMFRANETRVVLAKLFEMCSRNDCACAIVAHMGKNGLGKAAVNQSLGSVDIPAAMRSIIQIVKNPENDSERLAVHVKCSNAPTGKTLAYSIGDRGGVEFHGFTDFSTEDLSAAVKRKEKGIPYDQEPMVQVFNQLITDRPGGGFWSYDEVKLEGAKILGFPPFGSVGELKKRLDGGLARELQQKDGIIVTHSATGRSNVRGVQIEQYKVPTSYQTKIHG